MSRTALALPFLILAPAVAAQPVYAGLMDDIVVTMEDGVCYAETPVINEFDEFNVLVVRPGASLVVNNKTESTIEVAVFPSPEGFDGVLGPDAARLGAGDVAEIRVYDVSETTVHPISIKCRAASTPQGSDVWVEATTVVTIPDESGEAASWLLDEPFVLMVSRISGMRTEPPDTGGMRPKPAGEGP